jgi:hypothetical protein
VRALAHPGDRERAAKVRTGAGIPVGGAASSQFRLVWRTAAAFHTFKCKLLFERAWDDGGQVVGTLMDITDRKRSEESMREMQKLEAWACWRAASRTVTTAYRNRRQRQPAETEFPVDLRRRNRAYPDGSSRSDGPPDKPDACVFRPRPL